MHVFVWRSICKNLLSLNLCLEEEFEDWITKAFIWSVLAVECMGIERRHVLSPLEIRDDTVPLKP